MFHFLFVTEYLPTIPPLVDNERVAGDKTRLIEIVLHGLSGPLTIGDQTYGNQPNALPMPALAGLTDQQIADVLTFIRTRHVQASAVTTKEVEAVRATSRP